MAATGYLSFHSPNDRPEALQNGHRDEIGCNDLAHYQIQHLLQKGCCLLSEAITQALGRDPDP